MNIITKVPESVVKKLKSGETVYAQTNFNNYSKRAYQILSSIAQIPNFFFGFQDEEHLRCRLYPLMSESSKENQHTLCISIPDQYIHRHDYYDFSALIYWSEGYEGYFDEDIITDLTNAIKFHNQPQYFYKNEPKQVIFPKIKPEWVVSYQSLI